VIYIECCEVVIVVYDYVFSGVSSRGEERRRRSWGPNSVIISFEFAFGFTFLHLYLLCYILFEIAYLVSDCVCLYISHLLHCHILLRLYVFSLACYILAHHIVHIIQGYLVCLCISHYCIIISYLRETAIVLYRIVFV